MQAVSSSDLHARYENQSQMVCFQNRQYETTLASRLEGFAAATELVIQLGLLTESILVDTDINFKQLLQTAGYEYFGLGNQSSVATRINAALNFHKKSTVNCEIVSFHENILNEVMGNMLLEALTLYAEPLVADPVPVAESRCALKLAAKLAEDLVLLEVTGSPDDAIGTESNDSLKFLLLNQVFAEVI